MPRMFADDTCLIINAPTTNELIEKINLNLINVYNWMNANHLCINAEKSSALIIQPKSTHKVSLQNTKICYNKPTLEIASLAKYLGG